MATQNRLSVKAPTRKAGRYSLGQAQTVTDGAGVVIGRVGVGTDRNGASALVFESGQTQTGIPLYAVSQALAGGKVFEAVEIVGAFDESGRLDKLAAAVAKATPAAA